MAARTKASFAVAATVLLAASAVFAHLQRRILPASGLRTASGLLEPVSLDTVRAHMRSAGGPFTIEWDGYLIVPDTATYRFAADVDDEFDIDIDRQTVLRIEKPASKQGAVLLNRGLHAIHVRYVDHGGGQKLSVYFAREDGELSALPAGLLVPEVLPPAEIRLRRALAWVTPLVPLCGSAFLLTAAVALCAGPLRRHAPLPRTAWTVVALAAAAFACGIGWGLPDYFGWAPDELSPDTIIDVVQHRFAQGFASIYPMLHYFVLALFTLPFHLLALSGALPFDDVRVITAMFIVQRAVSILMATGAVICAATIAARWSPRASLLAAVFAACVLPLAYYAKTANVDVPSLFWFMLAMLCYVRAIGGSGRSEYVRFAAFGAAAIATKDQAYGFFVLPALATIVSAFRRGTPAPATVGWMALAAAAVFAAATNVVFNFAGFVGHVEIITGVGSAPYRIYAMSAAGEAAMFVEAVRQLGSTMSWPLLAAAALSAAAALRARETTVHALLLAVVSYYLAVIAIVGYHYDRFFLAPAFALAVTAAWGVDKWLAGATGGRRLRIAAVAAVAAYACLRVAALDTLLVRDSRYAAEDWLIANAPAGARIAAAGQYLPRRPKLFWTPIAQDPAELERLQPDFVMLNVGYSTRDLPGTRRNEFYDALSSGQAGYRKVFGYRTRPWWSPLNLESRFTSPREDPQSNLSKINPLIEVYARPPRSASPASSDGR